MAKQMTIIDVLGAPTRVLQGAAGPHGVALMVQEVPPGYAAPHHRHADEDEILYLLEGRLTVRLDNGPRRVTAGPISSMCPLP